ncbi:nuclear transport factor 2 family protein [Undibacterium sp. WLX3042]|uniref:nuclear transport factor 2 family protein n=1 Tax=Undibacterium sp. WLX3042 TaxID=3412686 RepID=UPI003C2C7940
MKKVILLVLIVAGGWWYFIGGRKLSDDHVNGFYRDLEIATLQRQPDAICALLAPDFQSTGSVSTAGNRQTVNQNKQQACDAYHDLYSTWEKLGEKMGGMLQLDSQYTIHSISLSPDGKTATVDVSSSLDVAGTLMHIRSRSTDTLVRRNGKVLLLHSSGLGSVGAGS